MLKRTEVRVVVITPSRTAAPDDTREAPGLRIGNTILVKFSDGEKAFTRRPGYSKRTGHWYMTGSHVGSGQPRIRLIEA